MPKPYNAEVAHLAKERIEESARVPLYAELPQPPVEVAASEAATKRGVVVVDLSVDFDFDMPF